MPRLQIARSLFALTASRYAPTRVCSRRTRARLFASRHRENKFRRRETRKEEIEEGGRADAKKGRKKKSGPRQMLYRRDQLEATRDGVVSSIPITFHPVGSAECIGRGARFTVTFYPFFALSSSTANDVLRETPSKCDVVFIDVAEIYADFVGRIRYSRVNVALCPRIIMTNY